MPLNFTTATVVSITAKEESAHERGFTAGYVILEEDRRKGVNKQVEDLRVRLGSQFDYESLQTAAMRLVALNLSREVPPAVLPAYATEGKAPAGDKLIPGEKALLTAVIVEHPITEVVEKTTETRKFLLFKGSKTESETRTIGSDRKLVIDFIIDNQDYTGRTGGSRIQLHLPEPKDEAGKREFQQLTSGLAKLGAGKGDLKLTNPEADALIQPTVIGTRLANGNLRPDAFAGMLERTNRIMRGTLSVDSPLTMSAPQLIRMLQSDLGQASGPSAGPAHTAGAQSHPSTPAPRSPAEELSDTFGELASEATRESIRRRKTRGVEASSEMTRFQSTLYHAGLQAGIIDQDGLTPARLKTLWDALDASVKAQPADYRSQAIAEAFEQGRVYVQAAERELHPELAPGVPSRAEAARLLANAQPQRQPDDGKPYTPMHRPGNMPYVPGRR